MIRIHYGREKNFFENLLGHFLRLQASIIVFFPTHFPPWVALILTDRVFLRVPCPHVLLQPLMVQDPHSQSIATAKLEVVRDKHIII